MRLISVNIFARIGTLSREDSRLSGQRKVAALRSGRLSTEPVDTNERAAMQYMGESQPRSNGEFVFADGHLDLH